MIKERGRFWTWLRGRIKPDEEPIAAVQREVLEEAGLAGAVEDLVHDVSYHIVKRGKCRRNMMTQYLFRAQAGTLRPDKGVWT